MMPPSPRRIGLVFLGILLLAHPGRSQSLRTPAGADPKLFQGPPAAFAPDIFGDRQKADATGTLRVLTVDERFGAARRAELVRVPLFFHAGECADPDSVRIVDAAGTPLPAQADDVRRNPQGGVARMHLYFETDLQPWERKRFRLVAGHNPGADLPPVPIREEGDRVTLGGDGLQLSFSTRGPTEGGIAAIRTPLGPVSIDGVLGPKLSLTRFFPAPPPPAPTPDIPHPPKPKAPPSRTNSLSYAAPDGLDVRRMAWASGPLFAKLVLGLAPHGVPDDALFVYRIPRAGSAFTLTEALYPEEQPDTADLVGAAKDGNVLLSGKLALGAADDGQQVVDVPAGVRPRLERVHAVSNQALVDAKAGLSLFPIPYVEVGAGGIAVDAATGAVDFSGAPDLRPGDGRTLRAFWDQETFLFTRATGPEALGAESRRAFGSLTAVVDEPWAAPDDFENLMPKIVPSFWKIPYWGKGWVQEAAMHALGRDTAKLEKVLTPPNGGALRPFGGLGDPYSFTYIFSGVVPISAWLRPDPGLDAIGGAAVRSLRQTNGRTDPYGYPYLQSFGPALNMHVGAYLMAIWSGKKDGDAALVQWARDAIHNETVQALYGRGQRPYTVNAGTGGNTDMLYECVSDFWLRATELICNEDLSLHPSVYGLYSDAVDVDADFYQGAIGPDGRRQPTWERALMFRGQEHDHRWESWDTAPYLQMFAKAPDGGRVGLTEACYWADHLVGTNINWSDLMPIFFADSLLRFGLDGYAPPPLPPLPANVRVERGAPGNTVTWDPVPGKVSGYRIYRSVRKGGGLYWIYLNSPYAEKPGTLVDGTRYPDPDGAPDSDYFVTAQDGEGRESRWFPGEPVPEPSRK